MQDPDDIEADPDLPVEVAEDRALRAEVARIWAALPADEQLQILEDDDDLKAQGRLGAVPFYAQWIARRMAGDVGD